jgi:hypothetical protein
LLLLPEAKKSNLPTASYEIQNALTRHFDHGLVSDTDAKDLDTQLVQGVLTALPLNHLADLRTQRQQLVGQAFI